MGGASVLCVSTTLCVSQPLAHTRAGACVSVLTEPQTHLSRCFVASTLVHATPPSPALTCSPSRAPPSPRPPFNTTVPAASELIGTVLAFAGQLGGRRARQAGDWRDGRGRGAAAGAAAWERGGAGRGGEGGAPSQAALCPSTAALPSDALCNAPCKALCKAPSNALCTAIAGAPGRGSRRGGADHALPCQPAAGR